MRLPSAHYAVPVGVGLAMLGWVTLFDPGARQTEPLAPRPPSDPPAGIPAAETVVVHPPTTDRALRDSTLERIRAAIDADPRSSGSDTLGREFLRERFVEDLTPVASRCYAVAGESAPPVATRIDVILTLVGHSRVGAVVETIDITGASDGASSQLLDCIRNGSMALVLAAPATSGSQTGRYSFGFEPPNAD